MQRDQLRASKQPNQIPPGPTTIWYQLPESHQHQLASLMAQLMEPRSRSKVRQGVHQ